MISDIFFSIAYFAGTVNHSKKTVVRNVWNMGKKLPSEKTAKKLRRRTENGAAAVRYISIAGFI